MSDGIPETTLAEAGRPSGNLDGRDAQGVGGGIDAGVASWTGHGPGCGCGECEGMRRDWTAGTGDGE